MEAAAERPEFEPPPQPGLWRGIGLAVLAHALLLVALTIGLRWKNDSGELAAEAELWSAVPQQAAPREQPAPPPPKAQPAPEPPKPVVREQPKPEPVKREADIALEREKKRKEAEAREAREKREAEERERQKKLEAQRKQQELQERKEQQAKLAAEKRRKEEEEKKRQEKARQEEEARLAKLREENLKRIQAMASGSGGPTAGGSAAQSSGPSAGYAGRIAARVKQFYTYNQEVPGNKPVEVEIQVASDGTVMSQRIVKSSGDAGFDQAVLGAFIKMGSVPRDNGRVYSPMIVKVSQ